MNAEPVNAYQYFFGGNGEEETPVPIPNTEVKLFSADGTAREAVWESRTLPKNFLNPGTGWWLRGFLFFRHRAFKSFGFKIKKVS